MVTENGRAELRGLYTDPAQPLTIAVGQAFDLVSMPAAVGHAALSALRARRVRLGPVVADSRKSVMRVGFLVEPARGPGLAAGPRAARMGPATEVDLRAAALDGRGQTREPAEAGHAETAALRDWAGRLGGALGVRVGGQGSTATLPPLLPWRGWLHWLVPPGASAAFWTPAGALLSVLSERSGARAL
ncbi:hypothetical protein [Catenulispora pinisilvae]|uniref:hypothetical protein n=1 Tax=Catenulispora pinisilvae TaxID=2705253 RepID=UPI00189241BD|nr:hypothetical protein [Catenulispora pinisilvae]